MSAAWAGGSTRAWRRLRAAVLERDGGRCQVPVEGRPCGVVARTVGHLDPLSAGGPKLAPMTKLRAECERHNYSDGARLGNATRRQPRRSWSWT